MRFSFALWCLNSLLIALHRMADQVFWVSSFSRPDQHLFLLALALIPCMEYDVVFLSIFVNSFILGLIEYGSSCASHSVAFFRNCPFLSRVCFSVSSSPSACAENNCFSSATSEEDVVTSRGVVCTSSLILRRIFSMTFNSNREKKSAAVFTEPAICPILKLNFST